MRRRAMVLALAVIALVTVAACGSSTTSSTQATPGQGVDKKVRNMLPDSVKQKGLLVVATSAAYPPVTFIGSDGKTIVGIYPDIVTAIGKVAGLRVEYVQTTFAGILTGIEAGRYDAGISFKDTVKREEQANFVDFQSGSDSWLVGASFPGSQSTLCGKPIGVGSGSAEATRLPTLSQQICTSKGRPAFDIKVFPTNEAPNAIVAGRLTAALEATEASGYAAKLSQGKLKLLGKPLPTNSLSGMALPKQPLSLAKALAAACQVTMQKKTYAKILKKWEATGTAVRSCRVNAVTATGTP